RGSVKVVASRLRNHAYVGAGIAAVRGIIESRLDLKLLYAVWVGNGNSSASRRAALHVTDADSVQLPIVVVRARSVYVNSIIRLGDLRQGGPAEPQLPGVEDSGDDPRRESGNLREIPGDQRKPAYGRFIDHPPERGVVCLSHQRLGQHLRTLGSRRQPKVELESHGFGHINDYVRETQGFEIGSFREQLIAARQ